MNISVLRNLSICIRNHLLNSQTNPNPLMPSSSIPVSCTRSSLRFHSSESNSSPDRNSARTQNQNGGVEDVDVVSDQELKRRIEKYYQGDEEAIPEIFEAILKRKLAGVGDKHDKLMEEVRRKSPSQDFDSESDELQ